ncbi:MAG: tetratricopeptide repeat protein [Anaerolineales bacterium]
MNRRRVRPNWFRIILLCLLVLGGAYVNRFVIPNQPSPFVPTPTVTRSPESFVTEAEGYFTEGKLEPAIDSYKQAIIASPSDPSLHVALARVEVWAGQYKDAQNSAEDALLLNPDNSMAHAVRAWALDFQGSYLEAETSITRAIELDPQNALAYAYYTEIILDSGGDVQKAIDASAKAIALAPDKLETHRARGYLLEATGNYEEAIREYQEAIKINNNIPDLHLSLGRNYRTLGIYDQAVDEFTRADTLNPQDPTPDLFISRTYATIGEFEKARQYAETAVNNNPADSNLHGNFGVMLYRTSYWSEAVDELGYVVNGGVTKDGIKIDKIELIPEQPRIAEYYFTYGLVLSRLNRCGEALQVSQLILSRVPADELAVDNANQIISRCQQNLNATPEPILSPTETAPAPTDVPTVEATATPTQ